MLYVSFTPALLTFRLLCLAVTLSLDMFSLDVLTLAMLLLDIHMLLPDTSLYHLTSDILPPDT